MNRSQNGPPHPKLSLCVGVTGHRDLAPEARPLLEEQIGALLSEIAEQVRRVATEQQQFFADEQPTLATLSQLARGSDQLVAEAGLAHGYAIRAVLPFAPELFVEDFEREADRETFFSLRDRAEAVWHLPGNREQPEQAYALAGEATVAQSDLLIAIWDGRTARGLGGTGDVVDYAVRRGVPVIYLQVDGRGVPALLWAGIDRLPSILLHKHNVPRRVDARAALPSLLEALLLPPDQTEERDFLAQYLGERERRLKLRLEYPLLLAGAGIRPFRRTSLLAPPLTTPAQAASGALPAFPALERAFAWADGLAEHFAQIYRSGGIFNFVAAALSVLVALLAFLLPGDKPPLVVLELVLTGGLILNTAIGNRQQWHRRWLDYRFLAEQLRVMRGLKLLSVATPVLDAARSAHEGRWTDFYAAGLWRQMGTPPTIPDEAALQRLARHLADTEIDGQIAYHHANAHRMHLLDHRLHLLGTLLFYATVAVGLVSLVGLTFHIGAIHDRMKLMTVLSAALPTVGAAVFGIRAQGDFAGAAGRSSRTAARLERVAANLRRSPLTLSDAARALEDATATMLDDLGEWEAAYRHRKLAIPS